MITVDSYGTRENLTDGTTLVSFVFFGASTDTMPTEYDGCKVRNGSVFVCTDAGNAGNVYLYNEENQQWNEVE